MVRQLTHKGFLSDYEIRLVHKNGEIKTCLVSGKIYREEGYFEGSLIDISERKKAEEAFEKNKTLLYATGRMARVGGWELDAKTLEVLWTEETYRIHEVPLDHKPPLQEAINFFHPEDQERLSQGIQRALEQLRQQLQRESRQFAAGPKGLRTRHETAKAAIDGIP